MEISQLLPKAVGMPEPSNYSKALSVILEHDDKNMLAIKYKSKQFKEMSAIEIFNQCNILLVKINVITGWQIPADEFQNILVEQICKKIVESYPNVNADEVEYAFRNRPTEIKDWGKNFSLTLFDEVMLPYLEKRFEVSKIEEVVKSNPIQKVYSDEEILNQRREEIEKSFQAMKKGHYPILHIYFKEVLLADGLTTENETIGEFFVRKLNSSVENIYIK